MSDEKGLIKLNDDEKETLRLRPGFMVTKEIDSVDWEIEIAAMSTKYRWERKREVEEDMGEEDEGCNNDEESSSISWTMISAVHLTLQ